MNSNIDLSIFGKFEFERPAIGIDFLLKKPDNVERLPHKMALCEMLKEAQNRKNPFYTDIENHTCGGGPGTLGLESNDKEDMKPVYSYISSGRLGLKYKIFKHQVANRRTLMNMPRLTEGSVKYVQFTPFDKISSDPDLLFILARPRQAEIILRSYSYSTGAPWEPKSTIIAGCSWLITYPYLSGKINYTTTGLCYGMIAWKLWPEGLIALSIPNDLLPMITQNLKDMEWELPAYEGSRDDYVQVYKSVFDEVYADLEAAGEMIGKRIPV